jgi:Fe-S-cluster containining protein
MRCIHAGHCCRLITLFFTRKEFEFVLKLFKEKKNPDYFFVKENMVVISTEEALKIRPELKVNSDKALANTTYLTCKQYNHTLKICMDYLNRPKMCRDFPFYGEEMDIIAMKKKVNEECGYLIHHPDYKKPEQT